ncbi:ATP-binding protein [Fluviispira multicolorata]|uniref:Histidine kinase domain-containing protein n=1 Tax=Fluviispira multicolorata TaxID=2654512 RepID=A0A833JBZ4_9BACT|nr:ATP-binding protein [Fluviispira multicolorata]KAB8029146.1 hypothetical protein GCL57_11450 [Fluviispira multicolorata]
MKNYFNNLSFYSFIKIELFCLILLSLVLVENYIYYKKNMNEIFYSGSGYIQHLSKFNNSDDILTRLIEFSLSIYNYEKSNSNNFSVDIWNCQICGEKNSPIWSITDIEINEVRKNIIKDNLKSNNSFIIFNKYLYIANIYETKNKEYKVVYYKKFIFFFGLPFIFSLVFLNIIFFFFLTFFIALPLRVFHARKQDKLISRIRVNTINNTVNLIKHSLDNQFNVLNSTGNKDEIVKRAIHYNQQVAELIDESSFTSINPEEFIKSFAKFSNINIQVIININTFNEINYINKYLEHAIIVLIDNALHASVQASQIKINILQKKNNSKVTIDITNNGTPIEESIKNKIFSGFTSKKDGHGKGLSNLKEMLNRSSADIILLKSRQTTFRITLPCLKDSRCRIIKNMTEQKIPKIILTENFKTKKSDPLVILLEDETLFWNSWKEKMTDAQILCFENPDSFFSHTIGMRIKNEPFLSKIDLIICDFNFGDYDLIDSEFFKDIYKYSDDLFTGNIIICSSFENNVKNRVPSEYLKLIKTFLPKKPIKYEDIIIKLA